MYGRICERCGNPFLTDLELGPPIEWRCGPCNIIDNPKAQTHILSRQESVRYYRLVRLKGEN